MPVPLTAPGVYIEEVSSGVRTITNVATSVAAFVGYTSRGIDDRAKRILSFADFDRAFGGLAFDSEVSYAVQQFFQNGGAEAFVVRVSKVGAKEATMMIRDDVDAGGADALRITALSKGEWGNGLLVDVDYEGAPDATAFNLTVTDTSSGTRESFTRVSIDRTRPNFVQDVVNDEVTGSKMIKVAVPAAAVARPAQTGTTGAVLTLNAAGQPTGLTANKTLTIKLVSDVPSAPAFPDTTIELLKKGDLIPTTVQGVCSLLEQQINRALAGVRGTSVRCVPATTITPTTRDVAIRVIVTATDAFDAVLEFKKGTTGGDNADADAGLHLKDGTANVGHYWMGATRAVAAQRLPTAGAPGGPLPGGNEIIGDPAKFTGIYALDKVDLFNILCIPDATRAKPGDPSTPDLDRTTIDNIFIKAAEYCGKRRAFLLIDPPPNIADIDTAAAWKSLMLKVRDKNAAAYFPRVRLSDPLKDSQLRAFAPCGVVAGLFARTDATRGVWKPPAGVEATLSGVQSLTYAMNDGENGVLNPLGLNCLRIFPVYGAVCWGARTLKGADVEADEWKYVPVRRLALFLEESLFRGTKWVVFEPNDEPLWAQIRLNVGAFMHTLFRQGAFQGKTPREAYLVKCDSETTTQDDINRGVVNILVGFAPLKPAEFVVIHIQQLAGDIQV